MFDHRLRAASILLLLGTASIAPACADGPGAGFKRDPNCVYDLKTGAFSIPPDFAENNAKAIKYPVPK